MRLPLFVLLLALGTHTFAQQTSVSVLGKRHADRASTMGDRPYGKDDISYGAFLDIFDGLGGWRFGATFSDDLSGENGVESVITPEIGLLAQDGFWEAGFSVLKDYVEIGEEKEWNSFYYQFYLGINLPLTRSLSIGGGAFYPFDGIGELTDFRFGDLDYAVSIRLRF